MYNIIIISYCCIGSSLAAEVSFNIQIISGKNFTVPNGVVSKEVITETLRSLSETNGISAITLPSATCSDSKPTEIALIREEDYGTDKVQLNRSMGVTFTAYPTGTTWIFTLLFSSSSEDQEKLLDMSRYISSYEKGSKISNYKQKSPNLRAASITTEEILIEGNPKLDESLVLNSSSRLIIITRKK